MEMDMQEPGEMCYYFRGEEHIPALIPKKRYGKNGLHVHVATSSLPA